MTAAERPPDRPTERQVDLPGRVRDIVRAYVDHRRYARTNIWRRDVPFMLDQKSSQPHRDYARDYNRLCEATFLAMRSRRSRQDFLDYFTSTFCAYPQFLPEADYRAVAQALLSDDTWEEVKALAMLTISSLYIRTREQPGGDA